MDDNTVIKIDKVSKDFILPHERTGSVKGIFTSMFSKATKKNEIQHALKDVSFEVRRGEFFGIVGRNGSGKSTLLKIIAGIYQPTSGKATTRGKLVPFIELGVGFNLELSGRDNVYLNGAVLGFSEKEVDAMYDEIVSFAELERFMDQKLKNYSSGMQVRLAFSMAIRSEADILLIDEVLAVGDADFQRKCFQYFHLLKKNKKTVVFVSHDMDGVRQYCDRAILLEKNKIIATGSAQKVAGLYTKLFFGDSNGNRHETGKRWGDEAASIQGVSISPSIVTDSTKEIKISWQVKANRMIENPLHGFNIKDPNGNNLLGTNSVMERLRADPIPINDSVAVEWTIPNVFSEGTYTVTPAIVSTDNTVHDWWEDAAVFEVKRSIKSPFPIQPYIKGTISN